jgi:pimeloyl-ACP methyl ester carboxylesterase
MDIRNQNSLDTAYLVRPEGRLAYDVQGSGALVVCLPGMGDLRQTYRYLVPTLVEAGYRVATLDIRGHGESDVTFSAYDDDALAADALALVDELTTDGESVVVVGNSMGAAATAIAAAERPEKVRGVVLLGAFLREPRVSRATTMLMRILMWPGWARFMWKSYLPKLYAGRKPDDFQAYRAAIIEALKQRGKTKAFSITTRSTHDAADAAAPSVQAPALVVMGTLDPDFKDPRAEADWIAAAVSGPAQVLMVEDCGHYPQSQAPDVVAPAVVSFLSELPADA